MSDWYMFSVQRREARDAMDETIVLIAAMLSGLVVGWSL